MLNLTSASTPTTSTQSFAAFVNAARGRGEIVVQPRMGFSDPEQMRDGLLATRRARAVSVGTLTLDSYTRVRDYASAARALADGAPLNGYPILSHLQQVTRGLLDSVRGPDFPVQVRHGSAEPYEIIRALSVLGLDATEGGPISYCLPYGRVPLRDAVRNWARSCELLSEQRETGAEPHLESFGGCLLGQLCPPSLLIAVSVLEAMFFRQHGLRSVSLSYAQQTNADQDAEALAVLGALAGHYLPDLDWHLVLYTYMGVYPTTRAGALRLLCDSAELAVRGGAARLIVKTSAESVRIPTVAENVEALELAGAVAAACTRSRPAAPPPDTGLLAEAGALIEAVLELDDDLGAAMLRAVERGYLDVPYCLHPDNPGRTRSLIGPDGRLGWADTGSLPISGRAAHVGRARAGSTDLLMALSYVKNRYDQAADLPESVLAGAAADTVRRGDPAAVGRAGRTVRTIRTLGKADH
ncbi:MAG TPA: methylaspartate mutase [Actinocrinis sp.]|nr:methylaspartate mutase [Actinocrinis sp.]